ncbi:SunS family peptide S-glycosyltransferase [Priestia megaterium]|uniref:SunS family peptide S-glycosyltransferase n=1 Tax=Priestia megaterium TaxID=1404 RepID=UPI003242F76E
MKLKDLYKGLNLNHEKSTLLEDLDLIYDFNYYEELNIDITTDLDLLVYEYHKSPFPTVTCGIITYNEVRCIEKCLTSVYNHFDELIVVDSLSEDGTVQIIQDNFPKVKVFEEPWRNDFSYQRNKVISLSNSDWIYFIDADNYYRESNAYKAKRIAKLVTFLNLNCVVSPIIHEHSGHCYYDTRRFFPLDKEILFTGNVHEEPTLGNGSIPLNLKVEIHVDHDGYNPELVDQTDKSKRNIKLTLEMLKKDRNNPKWLYFYAREVIQTTNDSELAKNLLDKALHLQKSFHDNRYHLDILLLLCEISLKNNKLQELFYYVSVLEKNFPLCTDIEYFKTAILFVDIQSKVKILADSLTKAIKSDEGKSFSGINSTNDHLRYMLVKMHMCLEEYESAYDVFDDIRSAELKEIISSKIHQLNQKITI